MLEKISSNLACDVQKSIKKIDLNSVGADSKKLASLPLDEFIKSSSKEVAPKKTDKLREFIIKFSPDCRKKLLVQIQAFFEEQTQKFYSELRTYSQIIDFEENKAIIEALLQKSPKELFCTNKEYCAFLEKLKQNIFNKIESNLFETEAEKSLYRRICDFYTPDFRKLNIREKYFSQEYFKNLDLDGIQSDFSPREIELKPIKDKSLDEIRKSLQKASSLTLDDGSLIEDYSDSDFYDFPMKFATACYNTFAQKGQAYIKEEMPEIFKGINEEELFKKLDTLSAVTKITPLKGMEFNFEIGGKKFTLEALSQGMEAATFKLKSQDGKSVIFKNFHARSDKAPKTNISFAPEGLYGGLGILREANLAKVSDVPKLYLANPIYEPLNGVIHKEQGYKGGWMISENVEDKIAPSEGVKFLDWIKEKGLVATDIRGDNVINGYCVDTGFILPRRFYNFYNSGWGNFEVNNVCARFITGNTTSEIIKLLQ